MKGINKKSCDFNIYFYIYNLLAILTPFSTAWVNTRTLYGVLAIQVTAL